MAYFPFVILFQLFSIDVFNNSLLKTIVRICKFDLAFRDILDIYSSDSISCGYDTKVITV